MSNQTTDVNAVDPVAEAQSSGLRADRDLPLPSSVGRPQQEEEKDQGSPVSHSVDVENEPPERDEPATSSAPVTKEKKPLVERLRERADYYESKFFPDPTDILREAADWIAREDIQRILGIRGEDFWMDELEYQLGRPLTPKGRDCLRMWLRAFAAHARRQGAGVAGLE